jgi:hypothetical protein
MDADFATVLARLKRLEARVNGHDAEIAELRREAGAAREADPIRWRRRILRELWTRHYRFMSRSGAAIAIAADWSAFAAARRNAPPAAGSRETTFAELAAGGCRPLSTRQIRDDLAGE